MKLVKKIFILLIFLTLYSCGSKSEEIDRIKRAEDGTVICTNTKESITKEDNIVIPHATDPVLWKGTYSETSIKISFTKDIGNDGESEKYAFIFNKTDYCPKIIRAYKFYNGNKVDVSAISEIDILSFNIKDWINDLKFSGIVTYKEPHNNHFVSRKFWIEFTEENKEIENTNYLFFSDCFGNKLPIKIDINKDGIIDYKMISEETRDIGNNPQFNFYTVKLISTNENKNQILSPISNITPHTVIYEAPFTSENKIQYMNDVRNALDVFYEFDAPYQNYNYFLNNNLTNKGILENNKNDYYIISMDFNNKRFYGWIKIHFNSSNCQIEILDTFLNTIPNQHITIN